jgi:hypothetical protein
MALYQHTPGASKCNAFCWLSWEQQCAWTTKEQNAAQIKRSEIIERKRAEGTDPLYIGGMGSKDVQYDPARFSVTARGKKRGVAHA